MGYTRCIELMCIRIMRHIARAHREGQARNGTLRRGVFLPRSFQVVGKHMGEESREVGGGGRGQEERKTHSHILRMLRLPFYHALAIHTQRRGWGRGGTPSICTREECKLKGSRVDNGQDRKIASYILHYLRRAIYSRSCSPAHSTRYAAQGSEAMIYVYAKSIVHLFLCSLADGGNCIYSAARVQPNNFLTPLISSDPFPFLQFRPSCGKIGPISQSNRT